MVKFQYRELVHPKEEVKNESEIFEGGVSNSKELRKSLTERDLAGRDRISDIADREHRIEILAKQWCCCCQSCTSWPKDAWTLLLTTVLFAIITAAQLIGAIISRSLALFGDSISVLVDVITYLSNLYAELSKASAR